MPADAGDGEAPAVRVLLGTDLVVVDRVESLLAGKPGLAERIFTTAELAYCASRGRRRPNHLAVRFAAKEAVMKALGTGASAGVEWTDMEVINAIGGRPTVRLHGGAAAVARRKGVRQAEISLSHTAGLAMASAVLLCTDERPVPAPAGTPDHDAGTALAIDRKP
ncbi:holo-ACP synthase [Streptomyces sp. NPDC093109]|uniref:holo-ACP synthase n=1 Tax=Streptomyces sp. NPDC093109 TaxID=3154977 RepID=UPI00344E4683